MHSAPLRAFAARQQSSVGSIVSQWIVEKLDGQKAN
jgi:hypothetical protein